jgi:exo-1,4-beta-D-glucosaminidase
MRRCSFVAFLITLAATGLTAPDLAAGQAGRLVLDKGWDLQSSAKITGAGDLLSTPKFKPQGWYRVDVPTTVVAALVANKTYPDPFFGMNLRQIPGTTYKVGANFSNFAMPADSPFAVSWWYRKQVTIPAGFAGKTIWLKLAGLNYRANVWLNGQQIASSKDIAGAWRIFELNVTAAAKPGAANVLAIEVFAQRETDLGINFVDWNPTPPDKNLGLWRGVELSATGPVAVRHPAVFTRLEGPDNERARLTVTAVLENSGKTAITAKVKGQIDKLRFEQDVELAPGERKDVSFDPDKFAQLVLDKPRLWWPVQMGTPALRDLGLEVSVAGRVSDRAQTTFGIREMTSQLDDNGSRVFFVNGKRILIRGAGWSSDMLMREDPGRIEDELRYVLDMGLNTVRLEGKLEGEPFLDFADRHGILIMAGWCCCDRWEAWDKWGETEHFISAESTRDQLYRLRSHPSLFAWVNGSDNPPPRKVEQRYIQMATETHWPNPVVSSASAKPAELTGPSGVKMTGPYDWIAPVYWLEDVKHGGAHGFNTETSAGPAVPPIESLRKMFPPDKLWPMNDHWVFHEGGQQFKQMNLYTAALESRYGKAETVEDFAFKSQLMAYENTRAMFEAFSRNKYRATGVIHWMLNNAWPGLIWHLYDYYLRPAGGYFGTKRALEGLHPLYSPTDRTVWVVNSQYQNVSGLKLAAQIYNLDMTEKFSREASIDVAADGTQSGFALPEVQDLSPTYFVRLTLHDGQGQLVGSNFYWLSTTPETLNYDATNWYMTPTKTFADFTALAQLPKVTLKVSNRSQAKAGETTTHVTLENPSKSLAFFVRLKVNRGARGDEILPVLWDDNYVSLMPGEKRELTARYRTSRLGAAKPSVEVSGWNVQ